MKKWLILMLVLGLTASANAVIITFETGGSGGTVDVLAGATVTVDVVADTACTSTYLISTMESTTSAAGDATATGVGAWHASFNANVQNGVLQNTMTTAGAGTPRFMLIDRASAGQSPAGNIAAGLVLYSFEVLIPAQAVFSDNFVITAALGPPSVGMPFYSHKLDGTTPASTNALTLHVIPEPATIALLGLGGLLLRRRK